MQKYNFFFNKAKLSFIITDEKNANISLSEDSFFYQGQEKLKVIVDDFLRGHRSKTVYMKENEKESAFRELYSFFRVEKAAGGIVKHELNGVLVIKRFGFYDFPKGHVEAGENWEQTAVREVEEETGVNRLRIVAPLPETYHFFMRGENIVLKETHWFMMESDYQGELKAQTEEMIEEARWVTLRELYHLYPLFYNTLQELMEHIPYISTI